MTVGHEDAGRLTYWEFTALRAKWNERHQTDKDDDDLEPATIEQVKRAFAKIPAAAFGGPH